MSNVWDRFSVTFRRRKKVVNLEAASDMIKKTWPDAYPKPNGNGRDITWFSGEQVIAHCWSPWNIYPAFWVRIKSEN